MNIKISLLGNANVGKTTLYNNLTKSFEHIGNWHGVTVEAKSKTFKYGHDTVTMTDLPGLYSLTVYSNEESVSRDNVLRQESDVIINICEVNNLARNLYLTLQLIEAGVPLVLAVNMTDELRLQGKVIDYKKLSYFLGMPVVPISAKYRKDTDKLLETAVKSARKYKENGDITHKVLYKTDNYRVLYIDAISEIVNINACAALLNARFCAIKLLENDEHIENLLKLSVFQLSEIKRLKNNICMGNGADSVSAIAETRYTFIDKIMKECVTQKRSVAHGFSRLDKILLNKYLALPIFLCVMCLVFYLTFGLLGKFLSECIKILVNDIIGGAVFNGLSGIKAPEWICYLLKDGIFSGVGGIISFLPQITMLFLFLALLEDTGYLSRVAYMTDGLFGKIGLSGRSVFTMLMGFGCSATAVMTARNCDSKQMRAKTVLITPFMSCSARLPVYAVVASAFFINQWLLIFLLYALGIAVAILVSWILEKIPAFRCPKPDFIMEMSPYRLPTARRVGLIIWTNMRAFLTRIATVVFGLTVSVWIMSNFTFSFRYVPLNPGSISMMQRIGGLVAWIFAPLGFGNWQATTALLSGFIAKETIIAALKSIVPDGNIAAVLNYDILSALSFAVFALLYVPCISTVTAIRKELGAKMMWFSILMQLGIAYAASFMVYWSGKLITSGRPGVIIGAVIFAAIIVYIAAVFYKSAKKRVLCGNCADCGLKNFRKK